MFAPSITATSFVLSHGPSHLSDLLGTTSRVVAATTRAAMLRVVPAAPVVRMARANAALNVGGYLPAGIPPVSAGYLSDAVGLTNGATVFAAVLTASR